MKSKIVREKNVICINRKPKNPNKVRVFSLDLFKDRHGNFSYTMTKTKTQIVSDQFIAYSVNKAVEDIVSYIGDPCEVLELTQMISERLGYEVEESSDSSPDIELTFEQGYDDDE